MGESKPIENTQSRNRSFKTLMQRLKRAGFGKDFVSKALFPDWWDDHCENDPGVVEELEIRIARFLNVPLASVHDPKVILTAPPYASAQLRRVRDIDRDRLAPAIHTAIRIATAVVRNFRGVHSSIEIPPSDPAEWRMSIQQSGSRLVLTDIVSDLWKRGIPVVPLEVVPTPSFQGMACLIEDRPVILLGHKHDEPSRVAFIVAHETEHIIAGDCGRDQPVVDEEYEISDASDIELRADTYATRFLLGDVAPSILRVENFKDLAQKAELMEGATGADASALIFAWARDTGDYATATMAVKALYRAVGARSQLLRIFKKHVDVDDAPETDRDLVRCVIPTK